MSRNHSIKVVIGPTQMCSLMAHVVVIKVVPCQLLRWSQTTFEKPHAFEAPEARTLISWVVHHNGICTTLGRLALLV